MSNYKSPSIGNEISSVMHGIAGELLADTEKLRDVLIDALDKEKFDILESVEHKFKPQGYTVTILLAESHVAIHTYPEYNSLYFNIYSCRGEDDGIKTYELLKSYLKPISVEFSKRKIIVKK